MVMKISRKHLRRIIREEYQRIHEDWEEAARKRRDAIFRGMMGHEDDEPMPEPEAEPEPPVGSGEKIATRLPTRVKTLRLPIGRGHAAHYHMEPPVYGGWDGDEGPYEYVVASAVDAFGDPETLVFPSDQSGKIVDFGEIGGGRGYKDPDKAIQDMGYKIVGASSGRPTRRPPEPRKRPRR